MPKQTKSIRKNFRFTNQIAGMLTDSASDLDLSENELASIAILDFLQDRNKFVMCPACKKKAFIKQLIPNSDLFTIDCACGTKIWYDPDGDKVVKFKKT